jgi:hypothetical protein
MHWRARMGYMVEKQKPGDNQTNRLEDITGSKSVEIYCQSRDSEFIAHAALRDQRAACDAQRRAPVLSR